MMLLVDSNENDDHVLMKEEIDDLSYNLDDDDKLMGHKIHINVMIECKLTTCNYE